MSKMNVNPLKGNLVTGMFLFALPIMGVAMLSMMFSLVDTLVITRFGHPNAVSSIGVSSALINLLSGCVSSLAVGSTAVLSQTYGKGDHKKVNEIANILPLIGLAIGLIICLGTELLSGQLMDWLNCEDVLRADALVYLRIYFLGMPFSAITVFLASAIQSKGDSFHPLMFELIAAVFNLGLNLFFVIVFDWNVFGVAIATVISQIIGCLIIFIYMLRQDKELKLTPFARKSFAMLPAIMKLGLPAAAEGVILNFVGVVISSTINTFSPDVIAGNTIAQSLEGLIVVSFVGFESASTVFVGQNYGKGDFARVKKVFLTTLVFVFTLCEICGILIYGFSGSILRIFTEDTAIIGYGQIRLFYMCLFFGFCGLMNALSGCVRGLGDSTKPLIISLIGSVAFRLSWILIYAAPKESLDLIYVSFPICWIICATLNILAFIYDMRKAHAKQNL